MRSRNVKPGLFENELLGTRDPLLTLTFVGLWMEADKRGRLEDRPLRIKAKIFPYRESLDINGYLTELERLGFILRYSVAGVNLIQVVNFEKHQSPHHTERESTLPGPDTNHQCSQHDERQPLVNGEATVNPPKSNGENPPDSLIHGFTDSLIPDSPKPEALADKSARRRATQLPDGFAPNEAHRRLCCELGVNLDTALAGFLDYHASKGSRFQDWNAALRTWIRNDNRMNRGRGTPKSPTPTTSLRGIDHSKGLQPNRDGTFRL
jgi:hypothetical protein